MRASIAELLISITESENQRAMTNLKAARADFIRFADLAEQADVGGSLNLGDVKAKALEIVDIACKKTIDMGAAAASVEASIPAQAEFMKSCGPPF